MDAIRIQNLRTLDDTGFIEIKPITLLVGQNNSGKSTLLRYLPLLKQSIEARTTGPMLWYGRLVDFGSYSEAVGHFRRDEPITLGYRFAINAKFLNQGRYTIGRLPGMRTVEISLGDLLCTLTVQLVESQKRTDTRVAHIELRFADQLLAMSIDSEGKISRFQVNQSNFSHLTNALEARHRVGIIPIPIAREGSRLDYMELILNHLIAKMRECGVHANTQDQTLVELARSYAVGSSEAMLERMQTTQSSATSWTMQVGSWSTNSASFIAVRDLAIAMRARELLMACADYIDSFAHNIFYIAPVRATAERYSRIQNLAVDEVDPQGANLTMFLRSLSDNEIRNFREWTDRHFGFTTSAHASGSGHISLRIQERESEFQINIADKGFGYSQVLPILTQLWWLRNGKRRSGMRMPYLSVPLTLAIEQPELHLHPRMQAQLLDAFVDSVTPSQRTNSGLHLFLETHSETIVNRLGQAIERGMISPDDVSIVLIEKENQGKPSRTRVGCYDSHGYITEWPYGFFEPSLGE